MVNLEDKTLEELEKLNREIRKSHKECPVCGNKTKVETNPLNGNEIRVYDCDCTDRVEQELQERKSHKRLSEKIDQLVDDAGVPKGYRDITIDKFGPQNESQSTALDVCRRYVSKWGKISSEGLGIIFSGGVGVGKTHLAISILRELIIEYQIEGKFVTVERWLSRIRGAMDYIEQTQEELISSLEDCDLAILDELAVEYLTPWEEKTLRRVIDYRVKNNLPILLTTNNSVEEIKSSLGPRLFSRLRGKTGGVEMTGDDMRTEQKVDLMEVLS